MYKNHLKNILDFSIAFIGFCFMLPIFVTILLGLYIANQGKPFFFQIRPGKNEQLFKIVKFKTMNDKKDSDGNLLSDAQRLTKIGNFVRKTSIDELPQLLNVLKGEMAIIGPRPERPVFVNEIIASVPLYQTRHVIKPGLTGWAQVNYPYGSDLKDNLMKLRYDLYYIKHRSIFIDINIIGLRVNIDKYRFGT